jgi:hypothetical protein
MDLKIRLPDGLDLRLRTHAENTGATLNSIICLAIDSFLPPAPRPEKPSAPEPVKAEKKVISASKQQLGKAPVMPKNPSKADLARLHAWKKAKAGSQGDLLDKA